MKYFFAGICLLLITNAFAAIPDSLGILNRDGKEYIKHLVEKGETHFSLSRKYGVSVDEILKENPETKEGLIAGTVLVIPYIKQDGKTHVIQPGETLFSLYRMYGVSIDQLKAWNNLKSNELSIGQKVIVGKSKPVNNDQKIKVEKSKQLSHKVEKGETLFSISRIYDVKWQEIKSANNLNSNILNEGQILIISGSKEEKNDKGEENKELSSDIENASDVHVVKMSETLYSIAKKYGLKENDIMTWNDLGSSDIFVGQELRLKPIEGSVKVPENVRDSSSITVGEERYMKGDPRVRITTIGGHKKIFEKGMAEVIEGATDTNRFLGLHKSAPVGTIIQVKNEINDISVFVRVVGKLPDIDLNKDLVIKITPKAFESLRGVDKKFKVEVSYLP